MFKVNHSFGNAPSIAHSLDLLPRFFHTFITSKEELVKDLFSFQFTTFDLNAKRKGMMRNNNSFFGSASIYRPHLSLRHL